MPVSLPKDASGARQRRSKLDSRVGHLPYTSWQARPPHLFQQLCAQGGRLPSASPGSALSSNTEPVPTRCGRRPSQVSRQQYCTTSIKIPLQIS